MSSQENHCLIIVCKGGGNIVICGSNQGRGMTSVSNAWPHYWGRGEGPCEARVTLCRGCYAMHSAKRIVHSEANHYAGEMLNKARVSRPDQRKNSEAKLRNSGGKWGIATSFSTRADHLLILARSQLVFIVCHWIAKMLCLNLAETL